MEDKEFKVKNIRLTKINRKTGEETEIINADDGVIKMKREKECDFSYRYRFDKNRDSIMHKQIAKDAERFINKLSYTDEGGCLKAKYLVEIMLVSPKPKTQQSKSSPKYKKLIKEQIEKRKKNLAKFKNKKLLVYICVYLRKERYEQSDVDNFTKPIIDGMKEYFGDDNIVQTVIVEKKMLDEQYDEKDLDFLECSLVVITEYGAKSMIMNV